MQKSNPTALILEETPKDTTKLPNSNIHIPKWLTEKNLDFLKTLVKITDDASEEDGFTALDGIRLVQKVWAYMDGNNGLSDFRKYRAWMKAHPGVPLPE